MNLLDFKKRKEDKKIISMVTCYDYMMAKIVADSNIDMILIGDSSAMVMHGYENTINATVEMITTHTLAVKKGAPNKFIVGDMPFLSYRKSLSETVEAAGMLMQAGANAVKLEGVDGHEDHIKHLVESGIPVMGHLGLTPQYIMQLGGFKTQGKDDQAAEMIYNQALKLEELGCFSIVLECIPSSLAKRITDKIAIPTIGIGAGPDTSGQVLVLQDLLGMNPGFKPKFLKTYLDGFNLLKDAINEFDHEVKTKIFPS